ncbi:hypothetical protein [Pseudomonas nitroreducens]|uniref:hypothetical protein n=1 Tax=Pseudomonas nitroreducens TaxID=46680 RepID=UPI002659CB12|nr:hypothetical protein [Pseudomonas nitroreducens]MCP1650444.1 hypothetical protein [Pseudomonas nitroreducens]MCP1688396.1 hypothetical protein [Pseudomonas nitroreducens]
MKQSALLKKILFSLLAALVIAALPGLIFPSLLPSVVYLGNDTALPFWTDPSLTRVLLPDDVMITLRAAYFLWESGSPVMNHTDTAQAATSYLMPLILAPLFSVLSFNGVVVATSLIGVFSIALTAILIYGNSPANKRVIITAAFLTNATTLYYFYSGWEPLLQALLVSIFFLLALGKERSSTGLALTGVIGALAVLARADSIFLALPVILCLAVDGTKERRKLIPLITFAIIGAGYAVLQFHWFHTLTPTTARLKAGSLPPFDYSLNYFLGLLTFGGAALVIPLIFMTRIGDLRNASRIHAYAIAGIIASYIYCFVVSDVFAAGRMYIAPLAFAAIVCATLPQSQQPLLTRAIQHLGAISIIAVALLSFYWMPKAGIQEKIEMPFVRIKGGESNQIVIKYLNPRISEGSAAAEQVALSYYIENNLTPQDGSIGLFYLGTGYQIPKFEVADFLGKADESIARTSPKWGPPGHNKWDIDKTIDKWNPAAIPLSMGIALQAPDVLERQLAAHNPFTFWNDLFLNKKVREGYTFCAPVSTIWTGLLVRNDVYTRIQNSCHRIP